MEADQKPSMPNVALASSVVLLLASSAALAREANLFAGLAFAAAFVPFAPRARQREAGILMALAAGGWALFSITRAPFSARTTVLLIGIIAVAFRVAALTGEAVRTYAGRR